MEFYKISLCFCLCVVTVLAIPSNHDFYEFRFRPCTYIKEVDNATVIPEASFHFCHLPLENRTNICKIAIEQEFCETHNIQFRDDISWSEERLYEVFLSGLHYRGRRPPFIVSACMCPTAPPMYFKDANNITEEGKTDVRIYVDLHVGEDEFGFTTPWKILAENETVRPFNPF